MLRKVKLYGPLADFVVERGGEKTMEADVSTPAEAVRFLIANSFKLLIVIGLIT